MALKEVKHLMGIKGHCQHDMSKFARFYDITSSLVIYIQETVDPFDFLQSFQ